MISMLMDVTLRRISAISVQHFGELEPHRMWISCGNSATHEAHGYQPPSLPFRCCI